MDHAMQNPGQVAGAQPPAAQAPAAPPPPAPQIVITNQDGVPTANVLSRDGIEALREQRGELSDQLISATNRRDNLAEELVNASGANREGIEARIRLLDQRILQIEGEIASTGRLLATSLAQNTEPDTPFRNTRMDMTAISIIFTIFVLGPIAFSMARMIWKRASGPKQNVLLDRDNNERLQRLESAVDTIAIEMERVSEGQRFVTKLLADAERQRIGVPRQ
jgi:hypothetical protein